MSMKKLQRIVLVLLLLGGGFFALKYAGVDFLEIFQKKDASVVPAEQDLPPKRPDNPFGGYDGLPFSTPMNASAN